MSRNLNKSYPCPGLQLKGDPMPCGRRISANKFLCLECADILRAQALRESEAKAAEAAPPSCPQCGGAVDPAPLVGPLERPEIALLPSPPRMLDAVTMPPLPGVAC